MTEVNPHSPYWETPESTSEGDLVTGHQEALLSETTELENKDSADMSIPTSRGVSPAAGLRSSKEGHSPRRASSDQNRIPRIEHESSMSSRRKSFSGRPVEDSAKPDLLEILGRPPSPVLRRTSTNSFREISLRALSRLQDPNAGPQTIPKLRKNKRPSPSPLAPVSSQLKYIRGFKWYPVRSFSDSSSTAYIQPKPAKRAKDLPLKPCMKHKSKSVATSPSIEHDTVYGLFVDEPMKKAKSVDFELVAKTSFAVPLLRVWEERTEAGSPYRRRSRRGNERDIGHLLSPRRIESCPGFHAKSRPADSAITRTDVHVVAVVPPSEAAPVGTLGRRQSPTVTPTIQIVESKQGRYEVIWDDVPKEQDALKDRRTSSAGLSLQAATTTSAEGLQRVNSKLSEWSWHEDKQAMLYTPQVVVYPDSDGHPVLDRPVLTDHLMVFAPPNSEASKTTSARTSRSASFLEANSPEPEEAPSETDDGATGVHAILHDDAYPRSASLGYGIRSSRGQKRLPSKRRLSNMPVSGLTFRRHKDSVVLAKQHFRQARGISPEHDTVPRETTVAEEDIIDTEPSSVPSSAYPESPASEPLPTTTAEDELSLPVAPGSRSTVQSLRESISTPVLPQGTQEPPYPNC
jgi:hypothetical protein